MGIRNICQALGYSIAVVTLLWLSLAVIRQTPFAFDTSLLQTIHQLSSTQMDTAMQLITQLVDPSWTVPFAAIVTVGLWFYSHRTEAAAFVLNCLGGAVLTIYLKMFFAKARPDLWASPLVEKTFSFPSGHALGAVVLYGFVAHLLGMRLPRHRNFFYLSAIALSLAIGLSRLYLGVHWPTDVMSGYIIGFLWTRLCITLLYKKRGY